LNDAMRRLRQLAANRRAHGVRIARWPSDVIAQPRTSGIRSRLSSTALMRELE
jgi:hypothetical protein